MTVLNGISTTAASGGHSLSVSLGGVAAATVTPRQAPTAATPTSSLPVVANDRARVSSTASLVSQALSTSDIRSEKVSALQSAIASGSYHVPASEVAGKLVDTLLK